MSFVDGLKEAGVVLLIGTDSGIPMKFHNQSTWNELDVGVNKFGIDPMYTIRAVDEAKDKLSIAS